MFGGVVVAVGGVIGATFLRNRKRRTLSNFLTRIDSTYNEFAVDREACRTRLERLKRDVIEMFNEGKINEGHFLMLDEKISEYLKELMQATPKHAERRVPMMIVVLLEMPVALHSQPLRSSTAVIAALNYHSTRKYARNAAQSSSTIDTT